MKTKIVVKLQVTDKPGPGDYPADGAFSESFLQTLLDGTGDAKAQISFGNESTLGASANEDVDLSGTIEDNVGQVLSFTKVKAIFVLADVDNAEDIVFGPSAANGFVAPFGDASDRLNVQPGGTAMLVAPNSGWTVTAGTADLLNFLAGGSGGTYKLIIVGEGTGA